MNGNFQEQTMNTTGRFLTGATVVGLTVAMITHPLSSHAR